MSRESSAARRARTLREARCRIECTFGERIVVAVLAANSGMSKYHFIRSFAAAYGETPGQFVVRLRMERAQELLATSDLPIREVGRRVGYRSHGSFSDRFRNYVGKSPTAYRQEHHASYQRPLKT